MFIDIKTAKICKSINLFDFFNECEDNDENAVSYLPLTIYEYTPDPNYPEQTEQITQVYANSLHLIQNPGGNANSKVARTKV